MASLWANEQADDFANWVESKQSKCANLYPSYEAAHMDWLLSGGLDEVACDYGMATEMLLEFLSRPAEERLVGVPIVAKDSNECHSWEHMTETGFRKLVYDWKTDSRAKHQATESEQERRAKLADSGTVDE